MRAGDLAPAIGDLRVLHPQGGPWSWAAVAGRVVVLFFWNNDPREGQIVARWNDLASRFADRGVVFAGESK